MPFAPYPLNPVRLEDLAAHYAGQPIAEMGYGTVRDYSDSVERLPELATVNRDLKDLQRPWAFKAVLRRVPRGSTLLEIGAGDPHVAHWLSLLGYRVLVVDPYDGYADGPTDFEFYRDNFPNIRFIRQSFSGDLADVEPASIDCVFSISVLEHVPHTALPAVVQAMKTFQRPGGFQVHAVDHVLKGAGEPFHRETLRMLCDSLGKSEAHLEATLKAATDDPDTYFLSAEAHNMWRGSIAYEQFPMRRCISVHFCVAAS